MPIHALAHRVIAKCGPAQDSLQDETAIWRSSSVCAIVDAWSSMDLPPETRVRVGDEQADGVDLPKAPEGKPVIRAREKWTLRRTLSVVLIVSGAFWLIAGIVIHLLLF